MTDEKKFPKTVKEKNKGKQIIHWKIPDVSSGDIKGRVRTIKSICARVDKLVETLDH